MNGDPHDSTPLRVVLGMYEWLMRVGGGPTTTLRITPRDTRRVAEPPIDDRRFWDGPRLEFRGPGAPGHSVRPKIQRHHPARPLREALRATQARCGRPPGPACHPTLGLGPRPIGRGLRRWRILG